jgi:uncharacterized protein YjbJ (UPF0337 family)
MENQTELLKESASETQVESPVASPKVTPSEPPQPEHQTLLQKFTKSSAAAKLSGTYNEATGLLKRKLGELNDDSMLRKEGRDQQLLGKVHHLVGNAREIRDLTQQKIETTRDEMKKLMKEHTGKLLDGVSSFLEDVKKRLF